ncbi:expressed unknown protein [Seminavis robusta]|uniref:GST N-terminal domain-containing protein n=1 Tax=Seminavis robusta TaxID=568900 RepID=A0A9N8DU32_9STRA|nr:expressed unknown protein [Seminavis robusta]|eukprot:Sro279_g106900.1 n/a (431) ;mRNA; r:68593-69885
MLSVATLSIVIVALLGGRDIEATFFPGSSRSASFLNSRHHFRKHPIDMPSVSEKGRPQQDEKAFSPMDMKPMLSKDLKQLRYVGLLVDTFARVGQRRPPSPSKTKHVRLIAISVSPYVEKVRWGLDLLEADATSPVYFTEDCHPPGCCALYTVKASNDQASQSPMIVDPEGKVLWGSDAILQHLFIDNENTAVDLYPNEIREDIIQFERDLGLRLGASARCLAYNSLLDPSKRYYETATKVLCNHSPWIEKLMYKMLLYSGKIAEVMSKTLNVFDPQVIENSEEQVRQVFVELSEKLEQAKSASPDNKEVYLMDTPTKQYGFTAADLSFAALVYFLLRPPEMGPFHVPLTDSPPLLVALHRELMNTTAGQHILKVYRQHRPVHKQTRQMVVRSVNQNRIPWKGIAGTVVAGLGVGIVLLFGRTGMKPPIG